MLVSGDSTQRQEGATFKGREEEEEEEAIEQNRPQWASDQPEEDDLNKGPFRQVFLTIPVR